MGKKKTHSYQSLKSLIKSFETDLESEGWSQINSDPNPTFWLSNVSSLRAFVSSAKLRTIIGLCESL